MGRIIKAAGDYLSLVKFIHTVFAMPFAMIGFTLAVTTTDHEFSLKLLVLIILCMIFARNAAMGFNRLADRKFDSLNPRTGQREIPSGRIGVSERFMLTNYVKHTFLRSLELGALYLDGLHKVAVERHIKVGVALLNPLHHRALIVLIASGNKLRINLLKGLLVLVGDLRLLLNDFPHLVVYTLNLSALCLCLLAKRNLTVVVTEVSGYQRADNDGNHK